MSKEERRRAVQSDWLQDIRDGETVSSKEMAYYVGELNRIDPAMGASKQRFTATEVALALFGTTDTKCVYALVESGAIAHSDFGVGTKRRATFIRDSIYEYLRKHCKNAGEL